MKLGLDLRTDQIEAMAFGEHAHLHEKLDLPEGKTT